MKRILLLIILGMGWSDGFSQVPSFFKDGARWLYNSWGADDSPAHEEWNINTQHIIHGDTIIGGVFYYQLFTTNKNYGRWNSTGGHYVTYYDTIGPEFIRHDTLTNKVYFISSPYYATERLLFDFDASVGDTIARASTDPDAFFVVDSIASKILWGDSVNFYYFHVIEPYSNPVYFPPENNYMIGGMGGANGLLDINPSFISLSGGTFTDLVCFQIGDSIYPSSSSSCPFLDYVSGVDEIEGDALSIYPNPAKNSISILTSEPRTTIRITNLLGEVFFSEKVIGSRKEIDVSQWPTGMYFVNKRKFVKE